LYKRKKRKESGPKIGFILKGV